MPSVASKPFVDTTRRVKAALSSSYFLLSLPSPSSFLLPLALIVNACACMCIHRISKWVLPEVKDLKAPGFGSYLGETLQIDFDFKLTCSNGTQHSLAVLLRQTGDPKPVRVEARQRNELPGSHC